MGNPVKIGGEDDRYSQVLFGTINGLVANQTELPGVHLPSFTLKHVTVEIENSKLDYRKFLRASLTLI